ncbi:hypothetical protein, partial [Streptococcus infantis]|uniref:hypothetical protein n=1 Tax=Streptococcus infantis TaxID=68892 RepID=UPI001CBB0522
KIKRRSNKFKNHSIHSIYKCSNEKDENKRKGKGDTVGKVVNHFQYEKWQKSSFLQERPDT